MANIRFSETAGGNAANLTNAVFVGYVGATDYEFPIALLNAAYAAASHTHAATDITSGTLVHERGGLEADVSAYAGLVKISGGATSAATIGIADDNIVEIDDADAADNDYAKFTANGIEGRSYAEVKTDLSLNAVENTALSTWAGTTNITTLGTIGTGTWNGTAIEGTAIASTGEAGGTKYLREDGDGTCSWQAVAGGGDVTKVGTPVNNQVGVWTGDGTIEGDTALTFNATGDVLTIAASGSLAFGAVTILADSAGTTTLSNIDALDATTEATIEAAIDTLANLTAAAALVTVGTVTTGTWGADLAADTVDAITEIAAALKTGADTTLVTGTAGTSGNLAEWDANGDCIDSGIGSTNVVTASDGTTITDFSDIAEALADGDEILVYNASGTATVKSAMTRIQTYCQAIKLDDFGTPDDNTDLDATTGRHGLLPKLGGGSTNFLRADGTWNAPAGGGGSWWTFEEKTGDFTVVADYHYLVDLNAAAADVTVSEMASPQDGDRVRVTVMKCDASHTYCVDWNSWSINGTTYSGKDQSSLWIEGESVELYYDTTNTTWRVLSDARIPHVLDMRKTTTQSIAGSESWETVDWAGVTPDIDNADLANVANDRIDIKRGSFYKITGQGSLDDIDDGEYSVVRTYDIGGTAELDRGASYASVDAQVMTLLVVTASDLATGKQVRMEVLHSNASSQTLVDWNPAHLSLVEVPTAL